MAVEKRIRQSRRSAVHRHARTTVEKVLCACKHQLMVFMQLRGTCFGTSIFTPGRLLLQSVIALMQGISILEPQRAGKQ